MVAAFGSYPGSEARVIRDFSLIRRPHSLLLRSLANSIRTGLLFCVAQLVQNMKRTGPISFQGFIKNLPNRFVYSSTRSLHVGFTRSLINVTVRTVVFEIRNIGVLGCPVKQILSRWNVNRRVHKKSSYEINWGQTTWKIVWLSWLTLKDGFISLIDVISEELFHWYPYRVFYQAEAPLIVSQFSFDRPQSSRSCLWVESIF